MAVKRINGIIKKLDWKEVEATLLSDERDDADPGFEVCEASLEDWERYVKTENQALMSRAMAFEGGRIYIVELPSGVHDGFCELFKVEMVFATGTRDHHLVSRGSSYVERLRKLEPDCSFGPAPGIGAIRPGGMTWIDIKGGSGRLTRMAVFGSESGSVEAISRRRIHSLHSSITSAACSSVQALHGE